MLTAAQRTMRDRYAAIGFTITDRPFTGTDRTKWYFANRPDSDERRSDFTLNLDSGICHQMGTNQLRSIDEAEAEYGDLTGKDSGNSDGRSQNVESQLGGLTPPRSPSKTPPRSPVKVKAEKPAKKKQAALF